MNSASRPLSPHLSIYKPQITSTLSILHRITGFFLYIGLLYLAWVMIFATFDNVVFAQLFLDLSVLIFSSFFGKLILFCWILCLNYHTVNGIRHLIWDAGIGFSKDSVTRSGVVALFCAVVLTSVTWFFIYNILFGYV
jgi:succinate dehydrogenase / fumarate reductase cytochrome b subunit